MHQMALGEITGTVILHDLPGFLPVIISYYGRSGRQSALF